jgi:aminocarboxymuconate-semialdehyde decarboxylase
MYGTDYPCWDPATALALLGELDLSQTDRERLLHDNAVRILNLRQPQAARACTREVTVA